MEREIIRVATIGEISDDLLVITEQLKLEISKHFQDKRSLKDLIYRASSKAVAINGLLKLNGVK